jgi:hypothetical protein
MFMTFIQVAGFTLAAILLGAGILHAIPKLGNAGRRVSQALCRAPLVDIPITYFTVAPLFVGPFVAGWVGFVGAVVGQVSGVLVWTVLHELANRRHVRGPRIVKVINRAVGPVRNHAATWVTALVTPLFWVVRVAELIVYPALVWLVDLPAYRHADWINVSRQRFTGLVGHDLIWCLYCDWMTGVWSLASEMLRNVESFWCPIRFDSAKKCANCATDFPDIEQGWVAADGTMGDVAETLERMYDNAQHPRAWFGHPVRITVQGKDVAEREIVTV